MKKFLWASLVAWDLCVGMALLRVDPHFQLHVLDIGQGDSILVTSVEQHHILVDGGPDDRVLGQLGAVLPLFFREIDLMVLTHPHADHVDGLVAVLKRFNVKAVLMSAPDYRTEDFDAFLRKVRGLRIAVYMARADVDFKLGGMDVDVLYPFGPVTGEHFDNVNNVSVVMKVSEAGHTVLLTGDAEKEVEAALLMSGVDMEAEVLKAGHHGSRSSSTEPFLEAVGAKLMVISCGFANSYGHPHRETLQKAAALGMEVLRTDVEGRVDFVFDDDEADVQSWVRSILAPSWRSFSSSRS